MLIIHIMQYDTKVRKRKRLLFCEMIFFILQNGVVFGSINQVLYQKLDPIADKILIPLILMLIPEYLSMK